MKQIKIFLAAILAAVTLTTTPKSEGAAGVFLLVSPGVNVFYGIIGAGAIVVGGGYLLKSCFGCHTWYYGLLMLDESASTIDTVQFSSFNPEQGQKMGLTVDEVGIWNANVSDVNQAVTSMITRWSAQGAKVQNKSQLSAYQAELMKEIQYLVKQGLIQPEVPQIFTKVTQYIAQQATAESKK